ncbi:MAG: acyl-CoA dehydrogenase family protein [Bdellovibrionota bacterium]
MAVARRPEEEDTPEQAEYRATLKKWLEKNLPSKPSFHLPLSFLEVETKDQLDYLQAWQKKCYEAGYVGIEVAKQYGGHGGQPWQAKIVNQEFARSRAPILFNVVAMRMAMPTILTHGTEEQKKKYVGRILSGDDVWAQGFSEPNAGSDLGSVQTFVEKRGDHYIANGHKIWTTVGQFGDYMILLARTNKEAKKHEGLSYFLLPMKQPGVEVKPLVKMTREATFNQVHIENAKIPLDCLLGREGQGWTIAMTTLLHERGASGGGDGQGLHVAFEGAVARIGKLAKEVKRGKSRAIDDPVVRDRLAQMAIEAECVRQNGTRLRVQALHDWPMGLLLMSKLTYSELMMRMQELSVELQGPAAGQGHGSPNAIDGGSWQLAHMNGYGPIIGGGTSEIQKNIIGERILGLAKG